MQITAMATPVHTRTHLSSLASLDQPVAVFAGVSLLFSATGRPDLTQPGPHHRDVFDRGSHGRQRRR